MKSFNEFRNVQLDEEVWQKTGKEAKHLKTGETTYEYAKYKDGEATGERHYRNAAGKVMGEDVQFEEGYVPAERLRPELSSGDKSNLGKVADLMAKEKSKKDLPFTPDKPHKPVAKAGKYGSGYSTARHLARQGLKDVQKEEVELDESTQSHKVSVTVSDPHHTMVSMRKEKIEKRVVVKAADKGEARAKAEAFYKKKGYKVHDSFHHSVQPATSLKTEEVEHLDEEGTPTGIKIYHTTKEGKPTHGIVFTPHDARTYEKEVKSSGGKVTHRAVMYGKTEGEKHAVKEGVEIAEETLEELKKSTLGSYIKKASTQAVTAGIVGTSLGAGHTPQKNKPEPGSKQFAKMRKREAGIRTAVDKLTKEETEMSQMDQYLAAISGNADFRSALEEKKLTPAEMKKREEIAQAIERENPGIDMSKKMAIATAQAKKVAEEVVEEEQIDEISTAAKQNYINAAAVDVARTGNMLGRAQVGQSKTSADASGKRIDKRLQGIATATSKLAKEEAELEEGYNELTKRAPLRMKVAAAQKMKGDTPDNEKEKSLAKLAKPYDKVTHADVLRGRGVTKEETEMKSYSQLMAELEEAKKDDYWDFKDLPKETSSGVRKVAGTRYGGSAQKDEPENDEEGKEEPAKRGRGRPAGSKSGARH